MVFSTDAINNAGDYYAWHVKALTRGVTDPGQTCPTLQHFSISNPTTSHRRSIIPSAVQIRSFLPSRAGRQTCISDKYLGSPGGLIVFLKRDFLILVHDSHLNADCHWTPDHEEPVESAQHIF